MDSSQEQLFVTASPLSSILSVHRLTCCFPSQQPVTPPFQHNSNSTFRRDLANRPTPIVTMNDNDMPIKSEAIASAGLWTTPTSHAMKPRPATIHEGFSYCMGEGYGGLSSWDPATLPLQDTPSDTMSSRPISVHQEFYTPTPMGTGTLT